jgi:hypothetical protein
MLFYRKTSSPAQTALMYVTIGTLTLVWTGVWYLYLLNYPPATPGVSYWVGGLALSGLVLVVIGLAVGQIGRAARHAESPAAVVPPNTATDPTAPAPVATVASPAVIAPTNGNPVPQSVGNPVATTAQPQR